MAADNILLFFGNGQMEGVGGTSCSAPLWAGFTALVNEAASAAGEPSAGFLNPALYAIGKSSDYTNQFNDITDGNNTNSVSPANFWAVPGYDLCTGWGTPKGSNLIASLAIPEPLRITPGTELVFTGPGGVPFNLSGPAFWLTNKGSSSVNWALATDADWLTLPETVGTLAAGGPATQITPELNLLANPLPAGTYHATLYFMNLNDQVVQTRQVTLAIAGTPPVLASPPRSLVVFAGMTASFTVGPAPDPFLSYQWQFNNGTYVTNLADGNGITGSSTPTLTISNASLANAGAYSVIVTNRLGSLTSPIAFLNVVPFGADHSLPAHRPDRAARSLRNVQRPSGRGPAAFLSLAIQRNQFDRRRRHCQLNRQYVDHCHGDSECGWNLFGGHYQWPRFDQQHRGGSRTDVSDCRRSHLGHAGFVQHELVRV